MKLSGKFRAALVAILATAALPCFASEVAVLRNGFSIRHERRQVLGNTTRLYVSTDGSSFVDIPTSEIEHFEAAPEIPAAAVESKSPPFANDGKDEAPGLPAAASVAIGVKDFRATMRSRCVTATEATGKTCCVIASRRIENAAEKLSS